MSLRLHCHWASQLSLAGPAWPWKCLGSPLPKGCMGGGQREGQVGLCSWGVAGHVVDRLHAWPMESKYLSQWFSTSYKVRSLPSGKRPCRCPGQREAWWGRPGPPLQPLRCLTEQALETTVWLRGNWSPDGRWDLVQFSKSSFSLAVHLLSHFHSEGTHRTWSGCCGCPSIPSPAHLKGPIAVLDGAHHEGFLCCLGHEAPGGSSHLVRDEFYHTVPPRAWRHWAQLPMDVTCWFWFSLWAFPSSLSLLPPSSFLGFPPPYPGRSFRLASGHPEGFGTAGFTRSSMPHVGGDSATWGAGQVAESPSVQYQTHRCYFWKIYFCQFWALIIGRWPMMRVQICIIFLWVKI